MTDNIGFLYWTALLCV